MMTVGMFGRHLAAHLTGEHGDSRQDVVDKCVDIAPHFECRVLLTLIEGRFGVKAWNLLL
jgi:hypothetical protein